MLQVINTLAPIVLLIGLGMYLGRSGFMPERKAVWANSLTYYIALPCLLFVETAKTQAALSDKLNTIAIVLIGMCLCIVIGYVLAYLLKLSQASTGAFVQAGFRGNVAYIAIPVILYGIGATDANVSALCMVVVAATVPFNNIAGVLVLTAGQQKLGLGVAGTVARNLLKNPLLLACIAGLSFSLFRWELPVALARTLEPLGRMALPLALLSIGVTLDLRKIRGQLSPIILASFVKVALGPILAWPIAHWLKLSPAETQIALVVLATPTASASFIMANLMRSDSDLTAGIIVVSTLMSLLPIAIITYAFTP